MPNVVGVWHADGSLIDEAFLATARIYPIELCILPVLLSAPDKPHNKCVDAIVRNKKRYNLKACNDWMQLQSLATLAARFVRASHPTFQPQPETLLFTTSVDGDSLTACTSPTWDTKIQVLKHVTQKNVLQSLLRRYSAFIAPDRWRKAVDGHGIKVHAVRYAETYV